MRSTFPIIFFLLITLPLALSSQCTPSNCASGCCTTPDTCATDESQCNYCNPENCPSGFCENNKCAASHSSKPGSLILIVALGASFVGIIALACLIYFRSRRSVIRARRSGDVQVQEKTVEGMAVIPIVEVQAGETEAEEVKGKEGDVVEGEEIPDRLFMRHMKEDRQAQEIYREAMYHYCEGHGENPKENDDKKKDEEIFPIDSLHEN